MAKSLILILTPFEMESVRIALVIALERSQNEKDKKALTRVKDKVEQMLSETSKARS